MNKFPQKFWNWAFEQRGALVADMLNSVEMSHEKLFLGFTRHTPAIITNGPAGLNSSIKGMGFVPKDEYLDETLDILLEHVNSKYDDSYSLRGLQILHDTIWSRPEIISKNHLSTIELAKKNTWTNLNDNDTVTILYYGPPMLSFELRGKAEIHTEGKYHKFVNALHDSYHKPDPSLWDNQPIYIFKINEMFDKSASKGGFNTKIM
jgi:hypothetical protein